VKDEYLHFLCCPECVSDLLLESSLIENGKIREGKLTSSNCGLSYIIHNFIPRFVGTKSYAESFGAQWNAFASVQLDDGHTSESALRFDSEIGWKRDKLDGKVVIEIGSGAGRFVDIISKRGAKLAIGVDVTTAVDAAQNNLRDRQNVFFIQADVFKLPVKKAYFDYAYSIGVLHHTPDPQLAFEKMVDTVKDFGGIAVSLYEISLYSRPNRNSIKVATMDVLWALNLWRCEFFRIFTTRVPDRAMIYYCKVVIPILHHLNKIPVVGLVRYLLPSTCYRKLPVYWSMLDTMDTYSTKIVHQYRAKDVFQWFLKLGLEDTKVMNGRAGWVSVTATRGDVNSRQQNRLVMRSPVGIGNIGD